MKILSALSLSFLCTLSLLAEKTYDLKYVWKPAKEYRFQQEMDLSTEMAMAGVTMKNDVEMAIALSYKTESAPEGVKVNSSFDSIVMEMEMNGEKMMAYDSTEPGANPMLEKSLSPITEMKISALYDEGGKLIRIEDFKAPAGGEMVGFGKKELEQYFQDYSEYFPKNPVKVGETWKGIFAMPSGQLSKEDASISTNMKLLSVETIEGKEYATIEFSAEPTSMDIQQGKVSLEMQIKEFEGVMIHDIANQITTESNTNIKMVMTLPKDEKNPEAPLQQIPVEGTTSLKLIEIK